MELKYIVMTIIKILISIPTVLLLSTDGISAASLMGGHLDNGNLTTATAAAFTGSSNTTWRENQTSPTAYQDESYSYEDGPSGMANSEEIPDPSALVLPGYNLPENIFNKGKPFYLEKDPVTGKVDFNSHTFSLSNEEEYEYVDEVPNSHDIYDKANIDRKDGSFGKYSHKTSDVNQLTPNFHDFLNLPVKYNSDKYVYPLISSSYANTKVQGNTNKYNHKNYGGGAVYKPTVSPTYSSNQVVHQKPTTASTSTTTTTTTTTKPPPPSTMVTTKAPNLMTGEIFPNYDEYTTRRSRPDLYLTTQNVNDIYLTTKTFSVPTTTKRTLSLFEQLFGEYDEIPTTTTVAIETHKPSVPSLFENLPTNKNVNTKTNYGNEPLKNGGDIKNVPNVLTGTNMKQENLYEYEEYETYSDETDTNSITQTKPSRSTTWYTPLPSSSTKAITITTKPTTTFTTTTSKPTTSTTSATTTTQSYKTYDVPTGFVISSPDSSEYDLDVEGNANYNSIVLPTKVHSTTEVTTKVTSLPLGENHFGNHHNHNPNPIIALTHNLKEQLNNEKVKPFNHQPVPSSNNIRISPDQDMVSFVVGHHQNVASAHIETSFNNFVPPPQPVPIPFKPLNQHQNKIQPDFLRPYAQTFNPFASGGGEVGGSSINIQPIKTSEASLSIGVPLNDGEGKKIPGQVVDESLKDKEVDYAPKGGGNKIVFPNDSEPTSSSFRPDFLAPPLPNREVLQLDSKPMYHQLPSDLTPPNEQEAPSVNFERPRPPWDPRPGHFYNGRPEYSRPPRPALIKPNGELYKRIDNLPNILPQFRPNVKTPVGPPVNHYDHMGSFKNGFMRQPLLERPSNNKPIEVFEKLVPPPPPKNLHNLRKIPILENKLKLKNAIEDTNVGKSEYEFYPPPHPPKVAVSNRRKSDEPNIETLQMIQAKHVGLGSSNVGVGGKLGSNVVGGIIGPKDVTISQPPPPVFQSTEKPLYVVYPVNSGPIKLDVIDSGKKETVVVGTRAELPLPPSKINAHHEFSYESIKERNEAPILKPHPKPPSNIFPVKSTFPYPIERPDLPVGNSIDLQDEKFPMNNQWNAFDDAEFRIVTSGNSKINYGGGSNSNQISVTLKTFTEKPIAVAYTPTEPNRRTENTERYSMPNYAGPVISEIIRHGSVDKSGGSEITVSAVMHTHPQIEHGEVNVAKPPPKISYLENHKVIDEIPNLASLGFQAPFQASLNVDGISQGWTVVRNDEKNSIDRSDQEVPETTTGSVPSTTKFDINNFKPQLLSGFKPIYSYSDDDPVKTETSSNQSRA